MDLLSLLQDDLAVEAKGYRHQLADGDAERGGEAGRRGERGRGALERSSDGDERGSAANSAAGSAANSAANSAKGSAAGSSALADLGGGDWDLGGDLRGRRVWK